MKAVEEGDEASGPPPEAQQALAEPEPSFGASPNALPRRSVGHPTRGGSSPHEPLIPRKLRAFTHITAVQQTFVLFLGSLAYDAGSVACVPTGWKEVDRGGHSNGDPTLGGLV